MKTLTNFFITLTAALTIHTAAATEDATLPPADTTIATTQIAVTPLQLPAISGHETNEVAKASDSRLPMLNLMTLTLLGFCGYASFLIVQPLFKKKDFRF